MGAGSGEVLGWSSRMSAPSPRPSAFLGIGNDLLGELRVAFCALAVNVVKDDRFTEAWCFCKPHFARNQAFEYLCSEETAHIRGNLAGERCSLIIHGKKDALDFEARVQSATDA